MIIGGIYEINQDIENENTIYKYDGVKELKGTECMCINWVGDSEVLVKILRNGKNIIVGIDKLDFVE